MLDYYTYLTAMIANILAFMAGTALTWTSPTFEQLALPSSPLPAPPTLTERGWIASLVSLGAVFGPFLFAPLADRLGRKPALLLAALPFCAGYLTLAFARTVALFCAARFVIGAGLGGMFTLMPMYIGEIATNANRGALGSVMNVFITLGLFLAYVVGHQLSIRAFNLLLAAIPVCFVALFWLVAPESPHHLLRRADPAAALAAIARLRGRDAKRNGRELDELRRQQAAAARGSLRDIVRSRALRRALVISLALVFFQQFSGINAVLSYTANIFAATGSTMAASDASIVVGGVQFVTSFITPFLVERSGRKVLFYVSALGMVVSEVPLGVFFYLQKHQNVDGIGWVPIVALILYIITYNFAFGPLPWAVMGELFPADVKSVASSVTAAFCWFLSFLITYFFETIADKIGMDVSFWIFSGFCFGAFVFTFVFVVETKGKSSLEILEILEK